MFSESKMRFLTGSDKISLVYSLHNQPFMPKAMTVKSATKIQYLLAISVFVKFTDGQNLWDFLSSLFHASNNVHCMSGLLFHMARPYSLHSTYQ